MAGAAAPMYSITACRIDLLESICSRSSAGLQRMCVQTLGIFGVSLPSLCTNAHLRVRLQIYVRTDENHVLEWNICEQQPCPYILSVTVGNTTMILVYYLISVYGGNPVCLHHLTPTATKSNVSSLRIDSLVLFYVTQNQLKLTTTSNPRNPIYSMSKSTSRKGNKR